MRRAIFAILCVSISTLCDGDAADVIRKNSQATQSRQSRQSSSRLLSRRKRYLIFPEGSSLQLVYCLTMPVIGESTIFTIGGTAALAWELPHDPFEPYRKPAEVLHRKDTVPEPKAQQSLGTVPAPIRFDGYQNPIATIHYSPAYNRYRYQSYQQAHRRQQQQFSGWQTRPMYYRYTQPKLPIRMMESIHPVNNLGGGADGYYASPEVAASTSRRASIYHQVHRRTRRELYAKIEKFLSTQSKDGKACLLRAICEVHQRRQAGEKGSFMEEILGAVFRAKPSEEEDNEDHYDHAADKRHNCAELYSSCNSSILNFI